MHSEMGRPTVRQNPIQRTVRTAHLSVLLDRDNWSVTDVLLAATGINKSSYNIKCRKQVPKKCS